MSTQTHTVTIAQALASTANGLSVLDTAANIAAALPNAGLVSRVSAFTITAPAVLGGTQLLALAGLGAALHAPAGGLQLNSAATVTAAQLVALEAMPGFTLGTAASLTLSDSTAQVASLLATHAAWFAQLAAVSVHLDGTAIGAYPATQLNNFAAHGKTLSFVATPGHTTLPIVAAAHDLGSNAASLNMLATREPLSIALSNEGATVNASDASGLATLQGFSPAAHTLYVADSGANIAAHAGALFGQGFTQIQVSAGSFAGTAAQLSDPALHFASGAHAQLASSATLGGAAAAALTGLPGFTIAQGAALAIVDSAAALAATAPSWLAFASTATLGASATVSAPTALTLAQAASTLGAGFSLGGNSLTVSDSLSALLGLPSQAASLATGLSLNANAVANAAQLGSFAGLPHATLGGHTITVTDTAANLLGLSGAALADSATQILSADATLSAAQLTSLSALPGFSAGGHAVTVLDTAANLLALPAAALAQAVAATLSADATVSAAQAQALMAEPGFSAGAHHLTIADTAANLLALPQSAQLAATTLALSADQAVSAATLTQLAGIGIKFSQAGHVLTCVDSAAALVSLAPNALALAGSEVLASPATVSAATALALAGLPHFAVASGATLTVQDNVANLLALGAGAPAATTAVQLAPGSVTITAAQGHALAAIPHFAPGSAAVTVSDSIAALAATANAGWQGVAGATQVTDSAANIAAAAASPLVQTASLVTLSGNGQVSAAGAALIAGIPHFTAGASQLSVLDTAAAIAAHAAAILTVASSAVVADSGPILAATADQLATVSSAGLLSFQGGDQLEVRDSFAALTNPANAQGFALAARIGVADTAANLVAASGHNWGALNPSYTLTQGAVITAAQASTLAGLGAHFTSAGFTLSVADTASAVTGAAGAIAALGITASVSDSAANLGAQASGLVGMGNAITVIHTTDTGSVTAATAAGVAPLAGKLSGPALQVADNAGNVDASRSGLSTLGVHAAITVTDSAANVAAVATDLAGLPNALAITLTDTAPVTAAIAAGLAPVATHFAAATALAVTDTSAAIVAHAAGLLALGTSLGTLGLSDGTTQPAATAAALAPLDGHLAAGIMLTATGSGASIAASHAGLMALYADGRLAGVVVANTSVADATGHAAALNTLPASVTVTDTAADVDAGLAGLAGLTGLSSITLSDGGTPALSMSLATLAADAQVLARIASPFSITITDTASAIGADLVAGAGSQIAAHLAQIGQITASDSAPVSLTQAQILAAGIDDGPASALARFTGTVNATGVDVAHVSMVAGLNHAPAAITVSDTALAISADLASGTSSLVGAGGVVTSITVADHGSIVLTASQALAAGVDDSASSVLARMQGGSLAVTGASIAQLAPLSGLDVPAGSIAVSDTASDISADLAAANPALVANLATITAITVSDAGTITLTEPQVLALQVDDGAGSVLARMSGGSLAVTGVAAGDLAQILGLGVAPGAISITDTGAHLVSNLASLVADRGVITAINVSGAPLVLTANEALAAHVDDGAGSVIDKLAGHAFNVTGASVSQLSQLVALADAPGSTAVTDSSADIAADLASGASVLASSLASVSAITVTHGTLTLTDAQAEAVLNTSSLDSVMSKLAPSTIVSVTGVPVSDISGLAGSGWPHVTLAVSDSTASIAADLASGNSTLQADQAFVGSVTLNAGGTVSAAILTQMAALPGVSTGGNQLIVSDNAASIAGLGQAAIGLSEAVHAADTDNNVAAQLDALQAKFAGALSITLTNSTPAIVVQAAQYAADAATIDAITNQGVVSVTGSAAAVAPLAAALGADGVVGAVTVTDSASDVVAGLSSLQQAGAKLSVTLTDTSLAANLVVPLLGIANLSPAGIPVLDTGSQIAAVAEAGNPAATAYLNTNGATLSGASAITAADAVALEGLTNFSKAGHMLEVWDTAAHLTQAAYQSALGNQAIDSVHLKTMGGAVTVTAAASSALFTIPGFTTANPDGSVNILNVSDTAAHIETVLSSLTSNRGAIGSITVNAPAIVADQVLSDLQGLGATSGTNAITVRDTAATIANNAGAQSGLHSIVASSWALSGSGTVSEAQAATLGNLANFSTGAYTITLNLSADTTISLADANALGHLAGSLNTNGHALIVDGTASQLATLTPGALSLVTPALIDSFANIVSLSANSPLLTGTVEVTGSDSLTAANVAAFLALVHTGPGQGIAAASLSFDQTHYVNDTVANLRGLIAGAGWSGNAGTHGDFTLVARDTVANLINPANTGFLSGLAVTALASNATIGAASATTLSNMASSIHFQHDHTIIVQDTSAALLNPANAAGLGIADTVQLSGPATVDAADAESLLGISHFSLTTPIVVSDSSANLLDGTLSSSISGSGFGAEISVQLAGPETLDADTAESLVGLPGFADTTNLTIADSTSYLLNSANLSAEQMAASVTLAGDETVSANTVLRLSQLPHFTPGTSHLVLAGNDFANAATLHAIAGDGTAFQANGHTVTLTQDVLDLSPTEYTALQADNVVANGHALGVTPAAAMVTDSANVMSLSATGLSGGTVHVYAANGTLISSATEANAGFTVTAPDTGTGQNFAVTETMAGVEGAPLVILDAASLEAAATTAGASFASSGQIQIDPGKYVNLYEAGAVPALTHAALVYDPVAHTVSLDLPGSGAVTLVTLGGTTHPASLDLSEILIKHHG